jgi:hypothetical protein
VKRCWGKIEDRELFLLLWIVLPLIFFSLSNSKLPHYILPIFPPLAMLTAGRIADIVDGAATRSRWLLALPIVPILVACAFAIAATLWVVILPRAIRHLADNLTLSIWAISLLLLPIVGKFFLGGFQGKWREGRFVYLCYGGASLLFACLVGQMSVAASYDRSAKTLAENSAPFVGADEQTIFYDEYLTGLAFYLRIDQPIWIVWSGHDTTIMDNIFVAQKQPAPAIGYGKTLWTYEEFAKEWKSARPLRVFLRKRQLPRLAQIDGGSPRILATDDRFVLATNR